MKKIIFLTVLLTVFLLFTSQQTPSNNVNGFTADAGSFEILSRYQGKTNVLKVDRSKTDWNIAKYSLAQYMGKEIFIEFSADVRREGSSGLLNWAVNFNNYYPIVSMIENTTPNRWHSMTGKMILTPTQDTFLYLTNWNMPANTTVYIANPVLTITEGNPLTPDLSSRPLKEIYANDFLIGNITSADGMYMRGKYFDLLKHHYNIINLNVFYGIIPSKKGEAYDFTLADSLLNTALRNNLQVYAHPLVYHGSNLEPAWLFEGTRDVVIQNMTNHINTVLGHFKGKINTWEVVNESLKRNVTAAEARGDWRRCVVSSHNSTWAHNRWYDIIGADYIELAFRAARAADPNVTLYINDDFQDANMAEVARKMIIEINDRYKRETGGTRNLIEGVGIQTHISGFNYDINKMRAILEKFTGLGIEIFITEVDVSKGGYDRGEGRDSVMTDNDAMAQALLYARLFSLFKEYSQHIRFVAFWGIDDGTSWLSINNPTLFDWKLNAKQAFYAISDPDGFIRQHGGRARR